MTHYDRFALRHLIHLFGLFIFEQLCVCSIEL